MTYKSITNSVRCEQHMIYFDIFID